MKDTITLRIKRTHLNSVTSTVQATLVRTDRDELDQPFNVVFPATLAFGLGIYPERELTITLHDNQ